NLANWDNNKTRSISKMADEVYQAATRWLGHHDCVEICFLQRQYLFMIGNPSNTKYSFLVFLDLITVVTYYFSIDLCTIQCRYLQTKVTTCSISYYTTLDFYIIY